MTASVKYGAATDIGRVREINEDSMLQKPPLFVVADGMGGHSAGDVASQMAVQAMERHVIDDADALTTAVKEANSEIFERAKQDEGLKGMGTTITALIASESSVKIAHVGDSRAYLLRAGELTRVTEDHTLVGRLVQQGRLTEEDAEHHPQRSYLERALGVEPDVEVDVTVMDIEPGDRIMLCSDGLYSMISAAQIAEVLLSEDEPEAAASQLCALAVEAGGADNVTTLVIDFPGQRVKSMKPQSAPLARNRRWMVKVGLIAALLIALAFAARAALDRTYYVGMHGGEVTVFRGVSGSFAGLNLSEPIDKTGLDVASLPTPEQSRLKEGISASDRDAANEIVANLKRIAGSQTQAPAPTTSPGAP